MIDLLYASLLTQTVTVETMGLSTADAYGNPTQIVVSTRVYPARLDARYARNFGSENQELLDGRDTVMTVYTLFLPPDAVITSLDQVIDSDGNVYVVMSGPTPIRDRDSIHHIEVWLRRVTG